MMLVVDNYKTFIGKEGNRFVLLTEEQKQEHSADQVRQIVVVNASAISFGAIKLAMESNVDIVHLGRRGHPHARVYPCTLGGTTLTRRRQLEAYYAEEGAYLAKQFITAKMRNQAALLRSLGKSRENHSLLFSAKSIGKGINDADALKGTIDEIRPKLLGMEGNASSVYFGALAGILPFSGRDRNSKDPVNILLNYGYGMLYGEIERACVIAGLDPYLGFMHTDRYGKPSMTLDLIEEFRQPIVDRTIITLFAQKQVEDADFEAHGDSRLLSRQGREKIIKAVLERLSQKVQHNGKQMGFKEIVVEQARNVTRFLLDRKQEYRGFTSRW